MSVLFESLAARNAPDNSLDFLLGSGLLGGDSSPLANGRGTLGDRSRTTTRTEPEGLGRRQVVLVVSPGIGDDPLAGGRQLRRNLRRGGSEGRRDQHGRARQRTTGASPTGTVIRRDRAGGRRGALEPSAVGLVFRLPLADFVENSAQLVTRAPAVIDAARSVADVIVVEAPPLLVVHHAEALSRAVDVVLVVGECWTTTYDDARRAGDCSQTHGGTGARCRADQRTVFPP